MVDPAGQLGGFAAPVVVHPLGFVAWAEHLRAEAAELEDRYARGNVPGGREQAQARLAEIDIEISHATRVESDRQALLADLALVSNSVA